MRLTNEETDEFQNSFIPISYGHLSRQLIEHSYSEFLDLIGRTTSDPNIQEEAKTCLWEYSAEIRELFLRILAIGSLSRILEDINRVIQQRDSILSLRFKLRRLSYDLFPALTMMGSPKPNIKASIDMLISGDYSKTPSLLYELAVQHDKQVIIPKITDKEKDRIEKLLKNEFLVQYKKSGITKSNNVTFDVVNGRIIIEKKTRFSIKIISDLRQWQIIDVKIKIPELVYYSKIHNEQNAALREILQAKLYILSRKKKIIQSKIDSKIKLVEEISDKNSNINSDADGDINNNSDRSDIDAIKDEIEALKKEKEDNEDVLGKIFELSNIVTGEMILEILLEQSILCAKEGGVCGVFYSEVNEYYYNKMKYKYLDVHLYKSINLKSLLTIAGFDNTPFKKYRLNKSNNTKGSLFNKNKYLNNEIEIILRFLMLPNGNINCIFWPLSLYINNKDKFNKDVNEILGEIERNEGWLYLCNWEKDNNKYILDLSKALSNVSKTMRYFIFELYYNSLINNDLIVNLNKEDKHSINVTLDENRNYLLINIFNYNEYIIEFDIFTGSLLIKDLNYENSTWKDYPVYYENLVKCIKNNTNSLMQILPHLIKLTKFQMIRDKFLNLNNWRYIVAPPECVKESIRNSYIDKNKSSMHDNEHECSFSSISNDMLILNTVIDNITKMTSSMGKLISEDKLIDAYDLFFYPNSDGNNLEIIYLRINNISYEIELFKLLYMKNNPCVDIDFNNLNNNFSIFGISNLDSNNNTKNILGKVIIAEFDLVSFSNNTEDEVILNVNKRYSDFINNNGEIIRLIELTQNIRANMYYDVYNKSEDNQVVFENTSEEIYSQHDSNVFSTNKDISVWFFPFRIYSKIDSNGFTHSNQNKEYDLLFQLYKSDISVPKVEFKIQVIKYICNNNGDKNSQDNNYYYKLTLKTNQSTKFSTLYLNGTIPLPLICNKYDGVSDSVYKLSDCYIIEYNYIDNPDQDEYKNNHLLNRWRLVDKISLIFGFGEKSINQLLFNLKILYIFIHIILETTYLCYYTIPNSQKASHKFYDYYHPIQRKDFKIINISPWKLDIKILSWPMLFGDKSVNKLLKLLNYKCGNLTIFLNNNSINVSFFDTILNSHFSRIYTNLILDSIYKIINTNNSGGDNIEIIRCYWNIMRTYEVMTVLSILQCRDNELLKSDFEGLYDSLKTMRLKNVLDINRYIISFGLRNIGMQILLLIELDKDLCCKLKIKLYDVLNIQSDGNIVKQSVEVINHTQKLLSEFMNSTSCHTINFDLLDNNVLTEIKETDYLNYKRIHTHISHFKSPNSVESELYYYPGYFFSKVIKSLSQFLTLSFYISVVSGVTQRKINNLINQVRMKIVNIKNNSSNNNNKTNDIPETKSDIIYISDDDDETDSIQYYNYLLQNIKQPILNWSGQNSQEVFRSSKFDNYYIKQPIIEFVWFYCRKSTIDIDRRHIIIFNRRWEGPLMYFNIPEYIRYKNNNGNNVDHSSRNTHEIGKFDPTNYSDLYNINDKTAQRIYWQLEFDIPLILSEDCSNKNLLFEFGNDTNVDLVTNSKNSLKYSDFPYKNDAQGNFSINKRAYSETLAKEEHCYMTYNDDYSCQYNKNKRNKHELKYDKLTSDPNKACSIIPFLCFPENITGIDTYSGTSVIQMNSSYNLELLTSPISSEFDIIRQFLLFIGKKSSFRTLIKAISTALCSSFPVIKDISLLLKYPLLSLQNRLPVYIEVICKYDDILLPIDKNDEKIYALKGFVYRIWKLDFSNSNITKHEGYSYNQKYNDKDIEADIAKSSYIDIEICIKSIPVNDIKDVEINGFGASQIFKSIKASPHLSVLSIVLDKLFRVPFDELAKLNSSNTIVPILNSPKYLSNTSDNFFSDDHHLINNNNNQNKTNSNTSFVSNTQCNIDGNSVEKLIIKQDNQIPSQSSSKFNIMGNSQEVIEVEDEIEEKQATKIQVSESNYTDKPSYSLLNNVSQSPLLKQVIIQDSVQNKIKSHHSLSPQLNKGNDFVNNQTISVDSIKQSFDSNHINNPYSDNSINHNHCNGDSNNNSNNDSGNNGNGSHNNNNNKSINFGNISSNDHNIIHSSSHNKRQHIAKNNYHSLSNTNDLHPHNVRNYPVHQYQTNPQNYIPHNNGRQNIHNSNYIQSERTIPSYRINQDSHASLNSTPSFPPIVSSVSVNPQMSQIIQGNSSSNHFNNNYQHVQMDQVMHPLNKRTQIVRTPVQNPLPYGSSSSFQHAVNCSPLNQPIPANYYSNSDNANYNNCVNVNSIAYPPQNNYSPQTQIHTNIFPNSFAQRNNNQIQISQPDHQPNHNNSLTTHSLVTHTFNQSNPSIYSRSFINVHKNSNIDINKNLCNNTNQSINHHLNHHKVQSTRPNPSHYPNNNANNYHVQNSTFDNTRPNNYVYSYSDNNNQNNVQSHIRNNQQMIRNNLTNDLYINNEANKHCFYNPDNNKQYAMVTNQSEVNNIDFDPQGLRRIINTNHNNVNLNHHMVNGNNASDSKNSIQYYQRNINSASQIQLNNNDIFKYSGDATTYNQLNGTFHQNSDHIRNMNAESTDIILNDMSKFNNGCYYNGRNSNQ